MSGDLVRHDVSGDGSVHTITLDSLPGNVIDIAMCEQFASALDSAAESIDAKVLVLRGAGKHFSFGASVEEHLPDKAPQMLAALGVVIRQLIGFPYPTIAAVQGSCLGGGLELALACGIVIAHEGATLASPEIQLGVIAPAATALMVGRAAEDLLLTGRSVSATDAQSMGIVNIVVGGDDLDGAVETFVGRHFVKRSPFSLRMATRAVRAGRVAEIEARLDAAERLYLDELLPSHDGVEGIRAFIDKRPPEWTNS